MRRSVKGFIPILLAVFTFGALHAQNLVRNGDLETAEPFFFSKYNSNGEAVWATDEAHTYFRSYKIDKSSTTSSEVGWMSGNFANLYWNAMADGATYTFGGWVKTSGINTSPANSDEEIGMQFEFYDDSGTLITESFVPIDQSSDTYDWTEFTDAAIMTSAPDSAICKLIMGKNATGTVWFDDISIGSDPWTAGMFGGDAETPAGWMFWTANDTAGLAEYTTTEAHSGTHSVKVQDMDHQSDEIVFYSTPFSVEAGAWYRVSAWVKVDTINSDPSMVASNVTTARMDDRAGFTFFFHEGDLTHSWSLVTPGDLFFYIDQSVGSYDGWRQVSVVYQAPANANGMSIRARFTSYPWGTVYYDDFTVEKITTGDNLVMNGDLETAEPFFFSKYNSNGEAVWATDEAHTYFRSYKIDKPSTTASEVGWMSQNFAQKYWNAMADEATYTFGGWVKTSGINTDPANDDEKIGLRFEFYDDSGTLITESFVPIDQSSDTYDWTEFTDAAIMTAQPDSAICKLVMGKDATGTVWFDDISIGSDPWTAGMFGGDAETPAGWMFWTASATDGTVKFVSDSVYEGSHAIEINEPDMNNDEIVFYSEPYPVEANAYYLVSGWVKTKNVTAGDSLVPTNYTNSRLDNRLGFTFFFHEGDLDHSWSLVSPGDYFFYVNQMDSTTDWSYYAVVIQAPEGANGMSMRARFTSNPVGTAWYDDFSTQKITGITTGIEDFGQQIAHQLPNKILLEPNYPNPFNPSTNIQFTIPFDGVVRADVYNVLGQKVKTLLNTWQTSGSHTIQWNGTNDQNQQVTSGMYFLKISTKDHVATQKMIMMR